MMDDLSVGTMTNEMKKRAAHRKVGLIGIQLRGCNCHTSSALGTVQVQESREREASSVQNNTDAPYLTHQLCGYDGHTLYDTCTMATALRGIWMDVCRRRVCPSPVSPQTSTSCRLGNVVARHLARVTAHARRTTNLHCSLQIPQCYACCNFPDYRMISDEDDV